MTYQFKALRKAWLPPQCPDCGEKPSDWTSASASRSLAASWLFSYRIYYERDPFWGLKFWHSECGKCQLKEIFTMKLPQLMTLPPPEYLPIKISDSGAWSSSLVPYREFK